MPTRLTRLAAAGYALWGALHIGIGGLLLATRLFGPADAFADVGIPAETSGHVKALIVQANVSMLAGATAVLVLAVRVAWHSPTRAYGWLLGISTLFAAQVTALELIPGHLPPAQVLPSLLVWAAANVVGTIAYRSAAAQPDRPRTESTRRPWDMTKSAAVAFAAWGTLHAVMASIFMGMLLLGPADALASAGIPADTSAHARALMVANNVSLLAGSIIVVGAAIAYGWKGWAAGYWVALGVSTLFFAEFLVLELIPGHVPWTHGVPSLTTWALSAALGTSAHRSRRTTPDGSAAAPPDTA